MIKRAQKMFITFTSIILLVVFASLFGITCMIMQKANQKIISHMLEELESNYYVDNNLDLQNGAMVIKVYSNLYQNESFVFEESHDEDYFINVSPQEILSKIASNSYIKIGHFDNIHFKVVENVESSVIFVIDGSFMNENYRSNVTRVLFALTITYLVLTIVVIAYSFKLFKPIKDSFEKQNQFVSDAGHELKTPITVIDANADIINQDSPSQWVSNIKEQTSRMKSLVSGLLTLAKTSEIPLKRTKEEVNLSDLVLEITLPFEAVAFENNKVIITDIEQSINLFINKDGAKQIINILLDNALKHSDKNSEIIVSLKRDGNKAVLTVINKGSKVPAGQEEKMFERFYRADSSRNRDFGGSGLGLSIAKSLAEQNKWKIFASSEFEKSMSITIIF